MLTTTAPHNPTGLHSVSHLQPALVTDSEEGSRYFDSSGLPDLPVKPETLLLLELKLQEQRVDLRQASQLVLSDLGATLQIFRLAAREYGGAGERPARIEDCIADLGLQACLAAISAESFTPTSLYSSVSDTWAHARNIANYARLSAEDAGDMHPDEAHLVGLLHLIGTLPQLFYGEGTKTTVADETLTGVLLAAQWGLPPCVQEFFSEMHRPGYSTRWTDLLSVAHDRADRSPVECSFQNGLRPRLYHRG